MKDTVTYPLSAITGDEEESRIDQLERELAEAVAKERERCAKVSEKYPSDLHTRPEQWLANEIAAAIRKGE